MADEDPTLTLAAQLQIDKLSITVAAKRTLKMGDDFKSFESSQSWTMSHPAGLMTPAVAKAAALMYAPVLVGKVYTDLVVAGVLTSEEYRALMARGKQMYETLLVGKKVERGVESSQGDLHGAGGNIGSSSPGSTTGA